MWEINICLFYSACDPRWNALMRIYQMFPASSTNISIDLTSALASLF